MSQFNKYLSVKNILRFSSLNYLQSILSFGVSMLLAREMGKSAYGAYVYGLVFYNSLSVLNQFGQDKTLVRDLVQRGNPDTVFAAATWVKLFSSAILLVGVFVWLAFSDKDFDTSVSVIACAITGVLWGIGPMAWFDYKGKMSQHALQGAVEKLIYICLAALIIFFWRDKQVVAKVVLALLTARVIMSVVEWSFVWHTISRPFDAIGPYIRQIIKDNTWVWLATIGNLLMTQANQLILESYSGKAELANYGLGFQIIMLVRLFQRQIQRLATPAISAVTDKKSGVVAKSAAIKMYKYCGLVFGLTLVFVVPIYLLAPWFVPLLAGEKFLDAVPVLNILLVWVSLYGAALINNQFLLGLHLQRSLFWTTTIFGLFSLFLAWWLIPIYQARGAALSLLIAHFSSIAVQFYLVIRKLGSKEIDVEATG